MKHVTSECLYRFANRIRQWKKINTRPYLLQRRRCKLVECLEYEFYTNCRKAVGCKILFFSDLHLSGKSIDEDIVGELLDYIRKFDADIILLGGDIVGYANSLDYTLEFLGRLKEFRGVKLAVAGNWECNKHWLGHDFWRKRYNDVGIHYLVDELYESDNLAIFGLDDINGKKKISKVIWPSGDKFRINLSHNPDSVIAMCGSQVGDLANLSIAGHTHGGQIRLPFIGALVSSSAYGRTIDYGIYRRSATNSLLLISAGLNSLSFPWRLNCPREVVAITLK